MCIRDRYYIISLKNKINLSINYTYYIDDNIEYPVISIKFYQNSLQIATFYEQTQQSIISLFVNKSIHNYSYINVLYPSITAPSYPIPPNLPGPSGNFYINTTTNILYKSDGIKWINEPLKRYWITSTISKYDGKYIFSNNKKTILLTYECAKLLCMISRSKKATMIRNFYIELEKILINYKDNIVKNLYEQLKIKRRIVLRTFNSHKKNKTYETHYYLYCCL